MVTLLLAMGMMKEPGINLNHLDGFFRGLICGPFVNHARCNDCALQCAFGDTGWNYCTSVVLSPVFSGEIVSGWVRRDMLRKHTVRYNELSLA